MLKEIGIMEVGGFRVGHAQDVQAATGCTVILCDRMSPVGLDVRGGGPASRESQILNPVAAAEGINAVLLSGGSAFGLDAAGGVQKYLEERDIGFDVGVTKVPLVSQSCLFDLVVGSKDVRPTGAMAYEACERASYEAPAEGNVGAGTGCSIGKYRGMARAMKSGFGTCAFQTGDLKVGALVAVNALGDVYGADGEPMAGLLNQEKTGLSNTLEEMFSDAEGKENLFTGNTTLGVVVTNAAFHKTQLTKIAGMTHNGYPPRAYHGRRRQYLRPVAGRRVRRFEPGGSHGRPSHGTCDPPGCLQRKIRLWPDGVGCAARQKRKWMRCSEAPGSGSRAGGFLCYTVNGASSASNCAVSSL